jgi:2-polyprenyl-6-methoxyphenol hydroxylase-like FAD-dependent oxidoreductase
MNPPHDVPVLIVGAGPTGLTAALELSRLGIGVRIVDRAPERSLTSRALGIQARTIELLRVRGVGDELVRLGNPAKATTLYSEGRKLAAIELHRMPSESTTYCCWLSRTPNGCSPSSSTGRASRSNAALNWSR